MSDQTEHEMKLEIMRLRKVVRNLLGRNEALVQECLKLIAVRDYAKKVYNLEALTVGMNTKIDQLKSLIETYD
jgi:hypothetical protein